MYLYTHVFLTIAQLVLQVTVNKFTHIRNTQYDLRITCNLRAHTHTYIQTRMCICTYIHAYVRALLLRRDLIQRVTQAATLYYNIYTYLCTRMRSSFAYVIFLYCNCYINFIVNLYYFSVCRFGQIDSYLSLTYAYIYISMRIYCSCTKVCMYACIYIFQCVCDPVHVLYLRYAYMHAYILYAYLNICMRKQFNNYVRFQLHIQPFFSYQNCVCLLQLFRRFEN
eukprot:TRINITY_DN17463_c0_g1_i4.p1 TRINITY_DN17463_c0_g1~~TRINITY_DN17463_c0_g1_i4.p1  ORF type:complete len:224 (-),score=-28.81 TRINITY_DN17463_c0_g1_i4:192-863(-)